jgi:hypothetical protein
MEKDEFVGFRIEAEKKKKLFEIAAREGYQYRGNISISALIQDVLEEVLNKRQCAV